MSNNRCRRFLRGIGRRIPCFVAWCLLLVLSTIYFVYISPWITNEISGIIPIIQMIILFYVINNFLLAIFTDPGRYSRAPPDENDDSENSFHKIGLFHILLVLKKKKISFL